MGDIMRGEYYDTGGDGKKHYHWNKIFGLLASIATVSAVVIGVFAWVFEKYFSMTPDAGGWYTLLVMGCMVVVLFLWFILWKSLPFNPSLLGLLSLGLGLIAVGVIQPDSIKYGDFELKKAKQEAEDATKIAYEATALLIWNQGRFGGGIPDQERVATKLLEHVYGKEGMPYRYYLQHQGVFLTPKEELDKLPEGSSPRGSGSPFFENYLKQNKQN